MQKRIVLITGATDGIGKQSALELAQMGYHVIIHGRNPDKIQATLNGILAKVPNASLDSVEADFESLSAIKVLSQTLHDKYTTIDVLVNNVGAQFQELRFSEEGVEIGFAVNHLAAFLLTSLLMDMLTLSDYRRIINVSSEMHRHVAHFHFDWIYGKGGAYSLYDYYSNTKLANLLFSYKLSARLAGKGFTVLSITPGLTDTHLNTQRTAELLSRAAPVEVGAVSMVKAVSAPSLQGKTAVFLNPAGNIERTSAASYDVAEQDKLWTLTEELLKMTFATVE